MNVIEGYVFLGMLDEAQQELDLLCVEVGMTRQQVAQCAADALSDLRE